MSKKMGTRRRVLGTFTAVAAVGSLAVVPATPSYAAANKVLKIEYWYQSSPGSTDLVGQWLNGVIPAFEKAHPGVTVESNYIDAPESAYYTKLDLLQSSASTSPDVVMEDTFLISSDETAGYLQPITSYVDSWPQWKDFSPAIQTLAAYDGQVYGVPYSTDDRYLWYNANIFKQAGLAVPWHPTNWAEIMSALETIHQKLPSVIPMNIFAGVPSGEASTFQGFLMLLYGTGWTLYDYKTNKWVVSSPGLSDAFNFLYNVYHDGLGAPPAQELTTTWRTDVNATLMPKGQLAVDLDGNFAPGNGGWTNKSFPNWEKVELYTPMPTMDGQAPGYDTLSGGWTLSVSKHSANPGLAMDYIEMASTAAGIAKINTLWGTLAPRADAASITSYASTQPNLKFSLSLLKYTNYRPAFPVYPKLSYVVQELTGDVISGSMTGAQAAASYTSQATKIVGAADAESLTQPMAHAQQYP
jgi:multiple sugar transport system substrate-binding protein